MGEPSEFDKFKKDMLKRFGSNALIGMDDFEELELIHSGSLMLDYLSGVGGLPKGLNLVYQGETGSGKTFLALLNILQFLKDHPDKKACLIDVENRLNKRRVLELGIDPARFFVTKKAKAEHVFDIMAEMVKGNDFGMVVVDSLSNVSSEQELSGVNEDSTNPGGQAKIIQKGYRKLTSDMMDVNSKQINIFICQLMDKMGAKKWEEKTMAKGGNAPKYMSSFTIEVTAVKAKDGTVKDEGGNALGRETRLYCPKNSISSHPFRKGTILIDFKDGIDRSHERFILGTGFGLIDRGGSIYTIGEHKFKGYDNLLKELKHNDDLIKIIEAKIFECIKSGQDMNSEEEVE